ncbi:bifunctional phosphopantothenoylcysteine decarboxylase/phosphopantothenate--cysteine ligase CoaBC [Sulfuriferula nivalis]|uniref:Coenzyme A biosynthesis bifunctional protein CoaBC n=1 Tax=Sulfuriferula nivalis TaxID=2675298 RepID=A0A809S4X0_9PROT|nr:bifunctional phosphopantothenoylcysteine decarboxylase/phosphopantothenate--cysteine ligase CoaBC [Sulfuriferula nivalis]BBP02128.1 phosphopantothenate synthase [Sulfuriferula nivalis]
MPQLAKKHILLGVTGGIAAYKAAELTRLLVKAGAHVRIVMTQAAMQFVGAQTFQALSGNPVITDMWNDAANGMAHINLTREADLAIIAPASADFIAKLAHGLADDMLSTLCLARTCPLLVAPAMNQQMWKNPATQRNITQLNADGIHLLGPASGEQACGETGLGRMLEPADLFQAIVAQFAPRCLAGKQILITAGPTIEKIDPVRAITNLSSGKMGYAMAQAALDAGATVTLISGPSCLTPPQNATIIKVESASDMLAAVNQHVAASDIFISVAAVADYRPELAHEQKIKKTADMLTLNLTPNVDILAQVAQRPQPPFCVGFAAETENLIANGTTKRQRKNIPLLVVNRAQDALGSDSNEVTLLDDHGAHPLARADKSSIARQIIQHLANLYQEAK